MRDLRTALGISLCLLILAGGISWYVFKKEPIKPGNADYQVTEQWALPKVLEEVSALAYLGQNQLACVQDEKGIIFIYDLTQSAITEEIPFGEDGDYEGIAIAQKDAFVLRSDGVLFWVKSFKEEPQVSSYETGLFDIPEVDVEGLSLNAEGNGLLVAAKHNSDHSEAYKIIIELLIRGDDLKEHNRLHLDMQDPAFASLDEDLEDKFSPSAIAVHPVSQQWYLLDARNSLLLITDAGLQPDRIIELDKSLLPQPEGLAFSEKGELYISTEGDGKPGKIVKLQL